jgi:hypothetical protein
MEITDITDSMEKIIEESKVRPCYNCNSTDIVYDTECVGYDLKTKEKLVTRGFVECMECRNVFIIGLTEEHAIKIWNMIYDLKYPKG